MLFVPAGDLLAETSFTEIEFAFVALITAITHVHVARAAFGAVNVKGIGERTPFNISSVSGEISPMSFLAGGNIFSS